MAKVQQSFSNNKDGPIYVSMEPWPECFELEPGEKLTLIWNASESGDAAQSTLSMSANLSSVRRRRLRRNGFEPRYDVTERWMPIMTTDTQAERRQVQTRKIATEEAFATPDLVKTWLEIARAHPGSTVDKETDTERNFSAGPCQVSEPPLVDCPPLRCSYAGRGGNAQPVAGLAVPPRREQGAESPAFDDSGWRSVAVPHDWSIMDKPDGTRRSSRKRSRAQDSGYLAGGIGWYRRHLTLTAEEAAQVVRLNFEAVYMDADIWLNGEHLTRHAYGYTAFSIDLTGKVRAGENVIAVRANHPDPSSRWYAGSGIIRPVTLEILDRVHLDPDSIFVTTPGGDAERGAVAVKACVGTAPARAQTVELVSRVVRSAGGRPSPRRSNAARPPGRAAELRRRASSLPRPLLWSPDSPNLYTLVQQVRIGGATVDERRTRFGIRTITFDAANGMRINGEPMEMHGGNFHHDNYMLGAAGVPTPTGARSS